MTSTTQHRIKRFLFIGPTDVDKSTLINILFNDNVSKLSLLNPVGTLEGSAGSTACFTTYYKFPDYAFTDSIGFGDNRFNEQDMLSMLQSLVKNSMVGYNKIYLCINYERISSDIQYYIELLIRIFGKKILNWCTIIFTNCNDQQMTKEEYIESNKQDTYIINVINSVQNVIFGDNMIDDEIEDILINRRQRLLDNLKQDIQNSNTDYYLSGPENSTNPLLAIYNMITMKFVKQKTYFEEIKKISDSVVNLSADKNFVNYYGQCPICWDDMLDTDSVYTKCHHIYHETCIKEWLNNEASNCPICRSSLSKKDSFLTPLYSKKKDPMTKEINKLFN